MSQTFPVTSLSQVFHQRHNAVPASMPTDIRVAHTHVMHAIHDVAAAFVAAAGLDVSRCQPQVLTPAEAVVATSAGIAAPVFGSNGGALAEPRAVCGSAGFLDELLRGLDCDGFVAAVQSALTWASKAAGHGLLLPMPLLALHRRRAMVWASQVSTERAAVQWTRGYML